SFLFREHPPARLSAGTAIGGLTSFAALWMTQQSQTQARQLASELRPPATGGLKLRFNRGPYPKRQRASQGLGGSASAGPRAPRGPPRTAPPPCRHQH